MTPKQREEAAIARILESWGLFVGDDDRHGEGYARKSALEIAAEIRRYMKRQERRRQREREAESAAFIRGDHARRRERHRKGSEGR